MKNALSLIFFISICCSLFCVKALSAEENCHPSEIYLVRHAEKMHISGEPDPNLTKRGQQRANSLAIKLKSIELDSIYASQFKRTQQTVQPTATSQSLKLEIRDAKASVALAKELLGRCQQNLLVAGHSNTIPVLLKALGLEFKVTIDGKSLRFQPEIYLDEKDDYGTLFKVTFAVDGKPALQLSVF